MTNKQLHYFATAFVALTLSVLAACGNKGGNNQPPVVNPLPQGYQQCMNCQNINGPVFFTAESLDFTGIIRLNWVFVGQNVLQNGLYYSGQTITPGTYVGLTATSGSAQINQSINLGYCMVPAGGYNLSTIQAGQWSYGIATNLVIQLTGPAQILIAFNGQVAGSGYLGSGQLSSSTNPVGRMFGNLQIQSVNGVNCQQIITVQ